MPARHTSTRFAYKSKHAAQLEHRDAGVEKEGMEKPACSYLDLLPAALVLVHRLTGLRYGLPHVGDDLCHLGKTSRRADGWTNGHGEDSLEVKVTYGLDAPLVVRDEGEELFGEEEDQRGRSLCETQHLLQHRQNAFPKKDTSRE